MFTLSNWKVVDGKLILELCTSMNLTELLENLTNPALLYFLLGIIAVQVKSDLKIPESSSKFIATYLL